MLRKEILEETHMSKYILPEYMAHVHDTKLNQIEYFVFPSQPPQESWDSEWVPLAPSSFHSQGSVILKLEDETWKKDIICEFCHSTPVY